jgi:heme exporter protein C
MSAAAPVGTGTPATRILGLLTLAGLVWVVLFGLVLSPPDAVQGESVRYLYLHVPAAWLAYLSFFVTALGSVLWLWKRTRNPGWDRLAGASAEIGVFFTALCLLTGSLWGRETWGSYWTWDARLTTTAMLLLLFIGYLALRRLPAPPDVRARRCAIAGIIAFVDVPIVHKSVEWWRTLHQPSTVKLGDAEIDGLMLFSLFVGVVAFTLLYVWLVIHRTRVAFLEDAVEAQELDLLIAERIAETEEV